MAQFFHGVETILVPTSSAPITTVATSVIGLVGTAPIGAVNTMTLVSSLQDCEQFGGDLYPMTINRSLKAIFEQGGAPVIVINVFDPETMADLITAEAITIANGRAQLDNVVLFDTGGATVSDPVVSGGSPWATYDEGDDYTIDQYGAFSIVAGGAIVEGDTVYVTYYTPDPTGLVSSDFVGSSSSPRTGFKLFVEALDTFGFNPKILICPEYSAIPAVAAEMSSKASYFRAVCLVDDEQGTSRASLVSHRTAAGNSFASTSRRLVPCAPWVKAYDYLGAIEVYPLSPYMAGIMAKTDRLEGYWVSPSNHTIEGVINSEYAMTGSGIADQTSDANVLNAAGIVTVFKVGGSRRLWGNRSAAWPTDTDVRSFIPLQRVEDIVDESIENGMLPFLDKPLVQATIDAIKETANQFISTLIQRGALLVGSEVYYDPADNTAPELALGHVVFRKVFMAGTPAERITFMSSIQINLLTNLS